MVCQLNNCPLGVAFPTQWIIIVLTTNKSDMANSKATGKVVKNVPGMIYIIREIPDPEVATPVEGIASIKLGIVYGNDEAIKFRENQMKTGSSSS